MCIRDSTDAAIDALVRMDDEEVLALIEAVDRADLDAVHVLSLIHISEPTRPY